MYWRGKLIGLFFGLLILKSPLAAIVGFLIGHYFDKGLGSAASRHSQVFLETLFSVMGYVSKADGRVSERELQIAREVMERLFLSAEQRQAAMLSFSRGKRPGFDVEAELINLQRFYVQQPGQIRLFFTLQVQAAQEEGGGYINPSKQHVLQQIALFLGVISPAFNQGYYQQQQSHHRHHQPPTNTTFTSIDDYALLNVTRTSSDADIKKAYRRLMSQHHPDKLAAKGLPATKIKQATEKTQQIKAAYDRIRAARGM